MDTDKVNIVEMQIKPAKLSIDWVLLECLLLIESI